MPERVTIREAARRLGVSADTIRRRVRGGRLGAVRERRGRGSILYVELPEAMPMAGAPGAGAPAADGPGEVEVLRDYVAELKRQLEVREREVRELHILLEQAQRALPSPKAGPNAEPTAVPYAQPRPGPASEREEPPTAWWGRLWHFVRL